MTRSPSEDRRTVGMDGPVYPLNLICAVPGCNDGHALQRHHLWRRSDMGGDKWWVKTTDDRIWGNCVNLCRYHHREVTDNIARVVYHENMFWWKDVLSEAMLLVWQPPEGFTEAIHPHLSGLIDEVEELKAEEKTLPLDEEIQDSKPPGKKRDDIDLTLVEKLGAAHVLMPGHEPDVCPTCLRKLPRPKDESKPEAPKVRKTWSVAVPLDRYEDGAEIIDTLIQEARVELNRNGLPYGEGKVVNYYILTTALGLFVTHAGSLMSDG